ncbi:MAG: hypothetical protein ONA90_02945 [candidate division KSB1 bacterium]|nr:hypothetical protein [candidate division KSB1 bacterium]
MKFGRAPTTLTIFNGLYPFPVVIGFMKQFELVLFLGRILWQHLQAISNSGVPVREVKVNYFSK